MSHGGRRAGAGRPKGRRNKRTLAARELVAEVQKARPEYNPVLALIELAEKAVSEGDLPLAKDCHNAAAPYLVPKLRPVEFDPDALVELERRLVAVRKEAGAFDYTYSVVDRVDRLAEARKRVANLNDAQRPHIELDTGIDRPPDEPASDPEPLSERRGKTVGRPVRNGPEAEVNAPEAANPPTTAMPPAPPRQVDPAGASARSYMPQGSDYDPYLDND